MDGIIQKPLSKGLSHQLPLQLLEKVLDIVVVTFCILVGFRKNKPGPSLLNILEDKINGFLS